MPTLPVVTVLDPRVGIAIRKAFSKRPAHMCSPMARPITLRECAVDHSREVKPSFPGPQIRDVIRPNLVQHPGVPLPFQRVDRVSVAQSMTAVVRHFFGQIHFNPSNHMVFATVCREMTAPSARRSATIFGAP